MTESGEDRRRRRQRTAQVERIILRLHEGGECREGRTSVVTGGGGGMWAGGLVCRDLRSPNCTAPADAQPLPGLPPRLEYGRETAPRIIAAVRKQTLRARIRRRPVWRLGTNRAFAAVALHQCPVRSRIPCPSHPLPAWHVLVKASAALGHAWAETLAITRPAGCSSAGAANFGCPAALLPRQLLTFRNHRHGGG